MLYFSASLLLQIHEISKGLSVLILSELTGLPWQYHLPIIKLPHLGHHSLGPFSPNSCSLHFKDICSVMKMTPIGSSWLGNENHIEVHTAKICEAEVAYGVISVNLSLLQEWPVPSLSDVPVLLSHCQTQIWRLRDHPLDQGMPGAH